MLIVLDTNIIVSAAWSPGRNAADIVSSVLFGRHTACFDLRILEEYHRVMRYPRFAFTEAEIHALLDPLIRQGIMVEAESFPDVSFARDESDRKFYEVARTVNALLVTGNLAHFPHDPRILSPADFCERFL